MGKNKSIVSFISNKFNCSDEKSYFINSENYGDDLALWLAEELGKRNIYILKESPFPKQEDFGWYIKIKFEDSFYNLIIGHYYQKETLRWVIWIERVCGFLQSLIGYKTNEIPKALSYLIHEILNNIYFINDIHWYCSEAFKKEPDLFSKSPE